MLRNNKAFLKLNPFSTHEYSLFASKKKLEKLIKIYGFVNIKTKNEHKTKYDNFIC